MFQRPAKIFSCFIIIMHITYTIIIISYIKYSVLLKFIKINNSLYFTYLVVQPTTCVLLNYSYHQNYQRWIKFDVTIELEFSCRCKSIGHSFLGDNQLLRYENSDSESCFPTSDRYFLPIFGVTGSEKSLYRYVSLAKVPNISVQYVPVHSSSTDPWA